MQNPRAEDPARVERTGWLLVAAGAVTILAAIGLWRAHWPAAYYRQLALFLNSTGAAIGIAGGRMAGAARARRLKRKPLVSGAATASETELPSAALPAEAGGTRTAAAINAGLLTLAFVVVFWGMLVPRPYAASVWANLLTPLLGLPLLFWPRGKVVVVYLGKNEPPQIIPAFMLCGFVLMLRAVDYPILGWGDVLLWAGILSVVFAALAWWRSDPRVKGLRKILNTAVVVLIALIYGAGAIVSLDRLLDTSPPKFEYVKIKEKYVSTGRSSRSYMISVSPPQAADRRVEFKIGQSAYDKAAVGDDLLIGEHKGAFGVRWFDQRSRIGPSAQIPAGKAVGGVTRMRCRVTAQGRLSDCVILSECPAGHGFGAASLKAARYFKMRPKTADGRPVDGGQVVIPIKWKMEGAEIPAACLAPARPQ